MKRLGIAREYIVEYMCICLNISARFYHLKFLSNVLHKSVNSVIDCPDYIPGFDTLLQQYVGCYILRSAEIIPV
jgi:hypothetical protein